MKNNFSVLSWAVMLSFAVRFCAPVEPALAQTAATDVTGRWTVTADFYGSPLLFTLQLKQQGETLTGDFDGDKLEGTKKGDAVYFLAKDEHGGTEEGKATLQGNTITGTVTFVN